MLRRCGAMYRQDSVGDYCGLDNPHGDSRDGHWWWPNPRLQDAKHRHNPPAMLMSAVGLSREFFLARRRDAGPSCYS